MVNFQNTLNHATIERERSCFFADKFFTIFIRPNTFTTTMANEHILWADDEIELLKPHILFLENKGYKLTTVNNGLDALEQVKKTYFDLVFLDENMPGIPGLEVLRPYGMCIFVWRATDPAIDHNTLAAALDRRGWLVSRQSQPTASTWR
mgnify:CR=1 FL=1